ncbi:MAG: hypothetical protein LBQ75_03005 [Zoogloeaceae bacterium]|jgi:hypothetical protein|nr:hypothetical protein [Zoogloeaceae bacterium]
MKRALTDFFPPCRKWLVVALLAVNLSGCAFNKNNSDYIPAEAILFGTPALVVMLPVAFAWAIVTWPIEITTMINEERERKNRESVEALAPKVRDYLKTACEKDERLFVKSGIDLNEGILVLNNRGNALLPLLKSAPKEGGYREIQYGYAIPWDNGEALGEVWWWAANKRPSVALKRKFFFEDGKGKTFQRNTKAFWEQAGLRKRVLKDSLQIKALRDEGWSEAGILKEYEQYMSESNVFDLPVDAPSARYALSIEDISTLEDRAHWVARGKITLMERNTGEAVAEYVGFQANTAPWEQKKSPSRIWNGFASSFKLCPSVGSYLDFPEMLSNFLRTIEKGARETVPDFKELLTEKKP